MLKSNIPAKVASERLGHSKLWYEYISKNLLKKDYWKYLVARKKIFRKF
jgi:hypothetical protein